MDCTNINIKQYIGLSEESKFIIDTQLDVWAEREKPVNKFNIPSLQTWGFGKIKELQITLKDFGFQDFYELICNHSKLLNEKSLLIDFLQSCEWIRREIEQINIVEMRELGGTMYTQKQIDAGIEVFEKYGPFIQVFKLANGDVTKIKKVEETEYQECFLTLCYLKDLTDYELRLNKKQ